MFLTKPNLSEDTRLSTIIIGVNHVYDLHTQNDLYYICEHGTYTVISCMTKEFYNLISGGNEK